MLRPFAHPVACCCVLVGVVAQSLSPSGEFSDLVECFFFYFNCFLPFTYRLKENFLNSDTNNNSQWCLQHQRKPISSIVYSPRHLSSEISSVGLFHNVLTDECFSFAKKKNHSHREVYKRRILILDLTVFLFLILRRQCPKWTGMLPVFTTC